MCMSNRKLIEKANEAANEADYEEYVLETWEEHVAGLAESFADHKGFSKSSKKYFVRVVMAFNELFTMLYDISDLNAENFCEFAEGGMSQAFDRFKEFCETWVEDADIKDEYEFREDEAVSYISGYEDYCYEQMKDRELGL